MKVKSLKKNMTELIIGETTILFSYETPVACHIDGDGFYRTKKFFSATTTRHINQWLRELRVTYAKERPQEFFETLSNKRDQS